jgi:hypothetical protein
MKKKWIMFSLFCAATGMLFFTAAFVTPGNRISSAATGKRIPDYPLPFNGGAVRHGSPLIVTVQWQEINLATYGLSQRTLAIVVRKVNGFGNTIPGSTRTYYANSNSNVSNVYDTDYVHVGTDIVKVTLSNQGYENIASANHVTYTVQP